MPFIKDIANYNSLSVVGLEKNTGKTECLNYILRQMSQKKERIAVTSIGLDGESKDLIGGGRKPQIFLYKGVFFTTGENHYRAKEVLSEIVEVSEERTSTGRLVTAQALTKGNITLSGPATTASLKRWINRVTTTHKAKLAIVDGALSRTSHASPAISSSMILNTGAALTLNRDELIRKTLFALKLIQLNKSKIQFPPSLLQKNWGIWLYSANDNSESLLYKSAFNLTTESVEIEPSQTIFVTGALTDSLLKRVIGEPKLKDKEVVVSDFTKIFISPHLLTLFENGGGRVTVLERSNLIAVCLNPVAPNGYTMDSQSLCKELSAASNLPIYDIFKS